MIDQQIGKEPISRTFELPEDLEARFVEQFSSIQTSYPGCFSRAVMGFVRNLPGFADLSSTADSYLRGELRVFLNKIVIVDPREFSSMTPQVFFDKKIKAHLGYLELFLSRAFLLLENDQNHLRQIREITALLERSEAEKREVNDVLTQTHKTAAEVQAQLELISEKATKDALTGLQNRLSYDEQMIDLAAKFPEERFAFMILDMDSFKEVNDVYGHKAGDEALQQLAALITGPDTGLRYEDVSRWGGEEFVVVTPDNGNRGLMIAEAVRKAVEAYTFVVTDTQGVEKRFKKTISIGLSRCLGEELTQEDAFKSADAALYKAKGKKFDEAGKLIQNPDDHSPKNRTWDSVKSEAEPRT